MGGDLLFCSRIALIFFLISPLFFLALETNTLFFFQNENQKDKQNEWDCVRDRSGKPGAVGNREDLERIARPEGARPNIREKRVRKG